MINKTELLDPTALEKRSLYERSAVEGAHNAGHGPRYINSESHCGSLQQIINPSAIKAAECGAPGCDSDISDGIASLSECWNSPRLLQTKIDISDYSHTWMNNE